MARWVYTSSNTVVPTRFFWGPTFVDNNISSPHTHRQAYSSFACLCLIQNYNLFVIGKQSNMLLFVFSMYSLQVDWYAPKLRFWDTTCEAEGEICVVTWYLCCTTHDNSIPPTPHFRDHCSNIIRYIVFNDIWHQMKSTSVTWWVHQL